MLTGLFCLFSTDLLDRLAGRRAEFRRFGGVHISAFSGTNPHENRALHRTRATINDSHAVARELRYVAISLLIVLDHEAHKVADGRTVSDDGDSHVLVKIGEI